MCLQEVCLGGLCNSHSRYLRTAFRKVLFLRLYKASYLYLLYMACSSRSLQSQFSVGQTPPYWSCAGGGGGCLTSSEDVWYKGVVMSFELLLVLLLLQPSTHLTFMASMAQCLFKLNSLPIRNFRCSLKRSYIVGQSQPALLGFCWARCWTLSLLNILRLLSDLSCR